MLLRCFNRYNTVQEGAGSHLSRDFALDLIISVEQRRLLQSLRPIFFERFFSLEFAPLPYKIRLLKGKKHFLQSIHFGPFDGARARTTVLVLVRSFKLPCRW
jgi:hypothetical protein